MKIKKTITVKVKKIFFNKLKAKKNKFRPCCYFTGRSKSILKNFRISRYMVRKCIHNCLFPGFKQFSW
nr:ribosomal protein S14 [Thonningia sanguinea]WJE89171.1 ribosomal protein S14 [Thonningia sanguinea]